MGLAGDRGRAAVCKLSWRACGGILHQRHRHAGGGPSVGHGQRRDQRRRRRCCFGLPGALVGGALGAFSGMLQGRTQIFEAKDDAFKSYYNALYDEGKQATEDGITDGSALAAARENNRISFTTLFGDQGRRTGI